MQAVFGSVRATMIRGLFLLVPIMVFVILIAKVLGVFRGLVEPLAGEMGPLAGIPMPNLLAVVVLLVLCFVAGLVAKASWSQRLTKWMESTVLTRIPGYTYMKGMGESAAGVEGATAYQPVLARIEDSWQLGFIVETIEPGQYAVYVPGAPSPWSGAVYFMAESRIKRIDMKIMDVQGCLKRLGIGSSELR
jgi:uncharacterized membrane protein